MLKKIMVFFQKFLLNYLRYAAIVQLWKYRKLNPRLKVIGISGSSGKTSTMNAVYAVLKEDFKVKYTYKANSETGIPLDILGFTPPESYTYLEWLKFAVFTPIKLLTNWNVYDIYIVEMGVDSIEEPKNMRYLLKILIPDIAIYLNVDSVHGSNYEHKLKSPSPASSEILMSDNGVADVIETQTHDKQESYKKQVIDIIAKDKNHLISALSNNSLAILNMNDPRVAESKELAKGRVIEVYGKSIPVFDYPLPKHYNITFEIAIVVAKQFGIGSIKATSLLKHNYKLEPGRCSIFEGKYDSLLIDSTYNSAPNALKDLIDLLNSFVTQVSTPPYNTRVFFKKSGEVLRVAILGDMRELGNNSKLEHENVAEYSIGKVDKYFLVGPEMSAHFYPKLLSLGVSADRIEVAENAKIIFPKISKFLSEVNSNKLILIKGSQNTIFLESIVKKLLLNPKNEKLLCRRGKMWDNIRAQYI